MLGKRLGIDLGTANVLVYALGRGIVFNQPSVVALAERDNRVVAIGNEAQEMLGRHPQSIAIIRPMREGVVADYLITEALLRYLISRSLGRLNFLRPEVMVCVPAGTTNVEQRAVREAAEAAGARRPAYLIPEPLAAAIGARLPIDSPRGHLIVNIGGGRSEAAVISLYGIVVAQSLRIAGDHLAEAVAVYIRRRHNLIVGERTAEEVKIATASALPLSEELKTDVKGRDQVTGMPRTITFTSQEATQAIQEHLQAIVAMIQSTLERTPPELAADVLDRGILLVGGGALLRHIDTYLTKALGIPCYVADNPTQCVAMGAGLALEHLELIKRSLPTEEELMANRYDGA
ncbi:MAG TPA: rod shape-determining protein [Dehalococcoidia bacterium]|nr:rod shape-determining protein [Dehalococcoidia bacterium]